MFYLKINFLPNKKHCSVIVVIRRLMMCREMVGIYCRVPKYVYGNYNKQSLFKG